MSMVQLQRLAKLPLLRFHSWHTPATDLPRQEIDGWRIHEIKYTRGYYTFYGLGGYGLFKVVKPLPITVLQERRGKRWHTWMVDDPPHWYAMQRYAKIAHGKVFMGGLGLGLALNAYLANPRVTGLTVVDRAQSVRDLFGATPTLPGHQAKPADSQWTFVCGDVLEVARDHHRRGFVYDHVLLDLWVAKGEPEKEWLVVTEVGPLVEAFKMLWLEATVLVHGFYQYTREVRLAESTADFGEFMPTATSMLP